MAPEEIDATSAWDDPDDDGWQEFKDGVAMGLHDREGNQLDPDEPDWGAHEEDRDED